MNNSGTGRKRRLQALDNEIARLDGLMERLDYQPPTERPRTFEDARAAAEARLSHLTAIEDVYKDPTLSPLAVQASEETIASRLVAAANSHDQQQFEEAVEAGQVWVDQYYDQS